MVNVPKYGPFCSGMFNLIFPNDIILLQNLRERQREREREREREMERERAREREREREAEGEKMRQREIEIDRDKMEIGSNIIELVAIPVND